MGQVLAVLGGVVYSYPYRDLAASSSWAGLSFIAPATGTIEAFGFQQHNTTSGVANAELYAVDSNGLLTGSAIASKTGITLSSYGFPYDNFTSTGSVVSGTRYFLAVKETSGTVRPHLGLGRVLPDAYKTYGWYTYDSGSNWHLGGVGVSINVKIGGVWYGTRQGRPAGVNLTSYPIYSTSGSRVARLGLVVKALETCTVQRTTHNIYKVGSPSGYIKGQIFDGTTLVATSISKIPTSDIGTSASDLYLRWNDVSWSKDTTYRLALTTEGYFGDASNYVVARGNGTMADSASFPAEANVLDGILGGCWSTVDSATPTWTDYLTQSTIINPIYALEGVLSGSSGGGMLVNPGFNGGVIQL